MEIQRLQLPPLPSSDQKRNVMRSFLLDSIIGAFECKWVCPKTNMLVGLRLERRSRSAGDYYREPHPLFLTIIAPAITCFPTIAFPLTDQAKLDLLSALEVNGQTV